MLSKATSSTIFLNLRYNLTWNWTLVSHTIGEHSNLYTNGSVHYAIMLLCRHHVVRLARISQTLSLSMSPYHSSPPAGLQGYIPYHHIAAVWMFELVVLLLIGHIRGSTGVHHLQSRPCFSSMSGSSSNIEQVLAATPHNALM